VTFLHYVEHVADIPGKRIARYQVPVMENGCRVWRSMEEFDTSGDGVHANCPDRFFAKIVGSLLTKTRNNGARVGKAVTYMLSARELLDFALPLVKAVAADPLAAESLKERSGHS
jgi:aminoglycoside 3-N-acetyltransferase